MKVDDHRVLAVDGNRRIFPPRGKARQFTNLESTVWSFDVAPDGKSIVLADGSIARDAELITGFD
ncbi:MAG TPA: hypothetical protein VLU46_03655 [Thermoanaerobaculia bacterium]|nr:hypothetical protein [Thermoanaerobaculia bacterium]